MFEQDLRAALQAASERLERAIKALEPKHKGGEMAEFRAAREELLSAERALAAALSEPHAVPLEFPVLWDTGAPLPHLLQTDDKTYLLFLLSEVRLQPDGYFATIVRTNDTPTTAIVEFAACISTKMDTPNDEVFIGHPLHGKGFDGYRPLRVVNSAWIDELRAINSVHRQYDPERWKTLNHYIFGFHDCTFECVARSFTVELTADPIHAVLATVCERLD